MIATVKRLLFATKLFMADEIFDELNTWLDWNYSDLKYLHSAEYYYYGQMKNCLWLEAWLDDACGKNLSRSIFSKNRQFKSWNSCSQWTADWILKPWSIFLLCFSNDTETENITWCSFQYRQFLTDCIKIRYLQSICNSKNLHLQNINQWTCNICWTKPNNATKRIWLSAYTRIQTLNKNWT